MARLKKSLAMLLAFAMIFSTMSVAASAWKSDAYSDNDVRFTVHFFRKDANGNWVDAEGRAAPGDEVQARVYLETTYASANISTALLFDATFFDQNIGVELDGLARNFAPTTNADHPMALSVATGSHSYATDVTRFRQNSGNRLVNYMVANGFTDDNYIKYDAETGTYVKTTTVDKDYFDYTGVILSNFQKYAYYVPVVPEELAHNADGSIAESSKNGWLYAVELKIKEDKRATIIDAEGKGGYAKVPALYTKSSMIPEGLDEELGTMESINPMFVNIPVSKQRADGSFYTVGMNSWDYDAEFDTTPGYVSTTSFINFDPNGGHFADGSEDPKKVAGIIKTAAADVEEPEKKDAIFGGWELVEGADDTLNFDYADKTFKAVWNELDPAKTTYVTKYYEMDVNGEYQVKGTSESKDTIEGETITAEYDAPAEGFYVDTEKSILSKTADADSLNNVLEVYYARNEYTVEYVYTDNAGTNKHTEKVLHGAKVPAFGDSFDGQVPEAAGKDFIGWSDKADGAVIDELPETVEGDLTFYAVYGTEKYIFTFYANPEEEKDGEAKFADGSTVATLEIEYGTTADEIAALAKKHFGDPELAGFEFIGWDNLPKSATEDLDVYPSYQAKDYAVKFFDKDGNLIENYKPEDLIFAYGEKVTADHIPEGYKSENAWTVNDTSTVAVFPYEVKDNVEFHAIDGANLYNATFKVVDENGTVVKTFVVPTAYLEKIETPDYEAPEGYDFSGWDYDIGSEGEVMDNVNGKEYTGTITPKDITVTFVIEGQADTVLTGKYDTVIEGIPSIPAKEGYAAGTWTPAVPEKFPAENTTYTATWSANSNTLTFVDVVDGKEEVLGEKTAATGEEIEAQKAPEKEGYTFTGWLCEDGSTIKTAPTVMPAKSQKYVAQWDINNYDYSFDANGGEFADDAVASGNADYGTEVPVPVPEKEGFEFVGWADADVTDPTEADVVIGKDVTEITLEEEVAYKAVWKKNVNTVTYDAGEGLITKEDGTTASKVEFDVSYGDAVPSVKDPVREGYTFINWTEKTDGTAAPDKMPNKSLYFVANWNKNPDPITDVEYTIYSVTQIPGTENYSEPVEVKTGAALPGTVIEVVEGTAGDNQYKFSDLVPQKSQVLDTTKPTSMTLTKEGPNELIIYSNLAEFTVTFDAGEGAWADGSTKTDSGKFGYEIEVPATEPTLEGYTFNGWTGYTEGDTFAEDKTYTADWTINTYEITFDSNGGSEVDPVEFEYGAEIKDLPEPSKDNFIFMGWADKDGNDLPAKMPAGDIEAFAKWTEAAKYEFVLDAGEGEFTDGEKEHKYEIYAGTSLKDYLAEEPVRDGYDFIGWFDEDGNEVDAATAKMPAEGMTVTAKWEITKYAVTYYLASGEAVEAYDTKYFAPGEEIVHPEDPELEGFTFNGWFDKDGNDLPEVMGEEAIDAYAKFDINTYKVTYMANGSVYAEYDVVYQAEVPVPADPTSADPALVFAGWDPSVEAVMPAYDLTYTAKFVSPEPDKYEAKFVVDGKTVDLQILAEGEEIVLPENPEKFGFKFVGWEPAVPAVMPAEDMEFVAQFEVDKGFLTVVIGGTVVAGGIIAGSIIGSNAAWITGVSIVGGVLVVVGAVVLAKHTHTVTYLVDGEEYKTYIVVEGTKIPVPADPTKDGFKFDGWNPEVPEKMGETDLVFEATWTDGDVSGDNDGDDSSDVNVEIPATGSVAGGLAAFAVISGAAAAAYVLTRKKKED